MTTRKVTHTDGAGAVAILDHERSTTMTIKTSTGTVTEMRRCHGSARFGIEPHEAPASTFPRQPSRKDGLGVMCTEHWKAYVKGLREARIAAAGPPVDEPATKANATTRRTPTTAKPAANADEVAKAEALIAEVDALPAERMAQRVGDADVQAALETSASVRDTVRLNHDASSGPRAHIRGPSSWTRTRVPMTACRGTPAPGRAHRGSRRDRACPSHEGRGGHRAYPRRVDQARGRARHPLLEGLAAPGRDQHEGWCDHPLRRLPRRSSRRSRRGRGGQGRPRATRSGRAPARSRDP